MHNRRNSLPKNCRNRQNMQNSYDLYNYNCIVAVFIYRIFLRVAARMFRLALRLSTTRVRQHTAGQAAQARTLGQSLGNVSRHFSHQTQDQGWSPHACMLGLAVGAGKK